jgi:hypothetical protein
MGEEVDETAVDEEDETAVDEEDETAVDEEDAGRRGWLNWGRTIEEEDVGCRGWSRRVGTNSGLCVRFLKINE